MESVPHLLINLLLNGMTEEQINIDQSVRDKKGKM